MGTIDLLKAARDIFQKTGGAVGTNIDKEGHVCATQAVAVAYDNYTKESSWDEIWWDAIGFLDGAAFELFGEHIGQKEDLRPIAQINDKFGTKAVMDVYDLAIKNAEKTN